MKLLLDTCALVWLAGDPARLGPSITSIMNADDTDLLLSDCSVWEICLKWQAGKLTLPTPPRIWLEEQRRLRQLQPLSIETTHLYRGSELPDHHKDPFDRLLIAQAIEGGLTIGTCDANIKKYPVATIW